MTSIIIPKNTYGFLHFLVSRQTQFACVVGYEVCNNTFLHKLEYIMKDNQVYGGGSVDLDDDKHYSFQLVSEADADDGADEAVCMDHD